MGTYLNLELKDKNEENIEAVNRLWNEENKGYENTLHFITREDVEKDVEAIQTDPEQAHLRYIETVNDWNKYFPAWAQGTFQVKLTMGDYLCSEMARRYTHFIEAHKDLFVKLPNTHVMNILRETANTIEIARECAVKCHFCNPIVSRT